VEPQQQSRRRKLIWVVGIGMALVVAIPLFGGYFFGWEWTGVVKDADFSKRTLWDWLQLLIIPAVLAGGTIWFNRRQQQRDQQSAEQRAQDEALQAYLDHMSQLLADKERPLSSAQPDDNLSTMARARTLTALTRLDGDRKRSVLQFLFESGLIYKYHSSLNESGLVESQHPIVSLSQADLSGAELSGVTLIGAYLGEADLSGADLSWASLLQAVLGGANLSKANLSEAWLDNAVLPGANLSRANLSGAGLAEAILGGGNLTHANLSGANLSGANLSGVSPIGDVILGADFSGADLRDADLSGAILNGVNLSGANLSGAKGISEEVLAQQTLSLEGATMPDGRKHEDWLKGKGDSWDSRT
jgi:uncharacterized protein YjbI with pentapeptide repeats